MHRPTHKPPAVAKPPSLWGLLLGLPAVASLAMLTTGQGGTGDAPPPNPLPPPAPPETPTPPTPPTLTQAQVDAIVARERRSTEEGAQAKLLKTLGYDSIEDAQAAAEARKAEAEKNLSDAQKATKRAEEAEAKARDRETAAATTERRAQVTLALAGAAVRPDRITQATTLLLADLDPTADEKAIGEAVKAQVTAMPEFYGATGGDGVDIAGRGRSGGKGGKDSYAAGLADGEAARKASNGATPFLAGFPGYPSGS